MGKFEGNWEKNCPDCSTKCNKRATVCKTCAFDFRAKKHSVRTQQLQKKHEQGQTCAKYGNSTRVTSKAMDSIAMLDGYGYDAMLIYQTKGSQRAETQILTYKDSRAAKFAETELVSNVKGLFASWIRRDKSTIEQPQESNNVVENATNEENGNGSAQTFSLLSEALVDEQRTSDESHTFMSPTNSTHIEEDDHARNDNEETEIDSEVTLTGTPVTVADVEEFIRNDPVLKDLSPENLCIINLGETESNVQQPFEIPVENDKEEDKIYEIQTVYKRRKKIDGIQMRLVKFKGYRKIEWIAESNITSLVN